MENTKDEKTIILVLLALALVLAGCGSPSEETQPTLALKDSTQPTTEATVPTEPAETQPPAPETVPGTVKADKTAVMLTTVNRGDKLDVVGQYDENHHVVKLEAGYGLIEKRLARLDTEGPFQPWSGFAAYGAKVYSDYLLRGAVTGELYLNRQVTVLEDLGDVLLVESGEIKGYIRKTQVSAYQIPTEQPKEEKKEGQDGGDIVLGWQGGVALLAAVAPQEGQVTGQATVLADGVPILLGWYDRNEEAALVAEEGFAPEKAGYYTVYLKGICGYVEKNLILKEGEQIYTPWDGYAVYGSKLYRGYDLRGDEIAAPQINSRIRVLQDLGSCYLVAVNGQEGYMPKEFVSEYFINLGGESSQDSSGNKEESGNADNSGSTEEPEWSPPVL